MIHLIASNGKYLMNKDGDNKFFSKEIYLAVNDSADNYTEVDETVKETYEKEQEEKLKASMEEKTTNE